MGRRSKLTPELQAKVEQLLSTGVTIETTCDQVGISRSSFYSWQQKGEAAKSGKYLEFLDTTTRAESMARIAATVAIAKAVKGTETVTHTTETITETRLQKAVNADGAAIQVPYDYTKTTSRHTVTAHPPDWRAAVEYLKRRDTEHWSGVGDISTTEVRIVIEHATNNDSHPYTVPPPGRDYQLPGSLQDRGNGAADREDNSRNLTH